MAMTKEQIKSEIDTLTAERNEHLETRSAADKKQREIGKKIADFEKQLVAMLFAQNNEATAEAAAKPKK